ncbi:uncharacterized protein LOC134179347 [Corticium candelabrum]|uniref:uncharacterized protein LOC134179347 n=1 Tax=Corticium candelabrum TaxID=121492 RepID=UPI002E274E91|nr:uncharacterized protein LOC134179347 [Corticium candelabrum]
METLDLDLREINADTEPEYERLSVTEVVSLCKVRTGRKFELDELCKLFIGKPASILCTLFILIYLWDWSSAAISATAFATNVPVGDHGTFLSRCTDQDFLFHVHPLGTCWNTYTLSVLVLGILSLVTALTELGEMSILQTALAIFRFTTIGAMVVYSMVTDSENKEDGNSKEGAVAWYQFSLLGFWLLLLPWFTRK